MKSLIGILLIMILALGINAQMTTISSGRMTIILNQIAGGIELFSVQDNGTELINTTASGELFTLLLQNPVTAVSYSISSDMGWGSVVVMSMGDRCTVTLTDPDNTDLPDSLKVIVKINTNDAKSDWDIEVSGLDTLSLLETDFPHLNILAPGADTFFLPYFGGKLIYNPASGISYDGLYPRGWGAPMQFMAYYNANRGLYFGFHDSTAARKILYVRDENAGVLVESQIDVPDKTLAGNDWSMPGNFEFDLYDGDYYDAAIRYRNWASAHAGYWPDSSAERKSRIKKIGDIGAWTYNYLSDGPMSLMQTLIETFADYMGIPVGVHLYEWNYKDHDDDYPDYFPERSGMAAMIDSVQTSRSVFVMPYINGRLFDTDLAGYPVDGKPYATKAADSSVFTQTFNSNTFAVMCPTQTHWQDTIIDASKQLTDRIGSYGVYLDQVCAASSIQCMDQSHGHTLGGGDYWRTGYNKMMDRIHSTIPSGRFVTSESACDFLADQVEGFLVEGWTTTNQVPAFTIVYGAKNILFGTKTGTSHYGDQQFYGKLARAFTFGFQPGRLSAWLFMNLGTASPEKKMAAQYVRRLGKMRYKLRQFMSHGKMLHSINLKGEIPNISYPVYDSGLKKDVVTPAIQHSVWRHGDSIIIAFVNGKIPPTANVIDDSLSFSFDFDGSKYGMSGALAVTEWTDTSQGVTHYLPNSFHQKVQIRSISPKAFLIRPAALLGNTYYVSTSGNDANSGLSEADAWRTISYAASANSPVSPGDIVYIKAGYYPNEIDTFSTSGADTLPILFKGYQTIPGDYPQLHHQFGDPLDSTVMPLLDGGDRSTAGSALVLNGRSYIELNNLQITQYNIAVEGYYCSHISLDNLTMTELGNVSDSYDGKGISLSTNNSGLGGEYNVVTHCFVENAAAEGYSITGDHNRIEHCKVYCDQNTDNAAMDYYIIVSGNNNVLDSCYAERIGLLDHDGHGIGFKGDCQHNRVRNSTAKNLGEGFYVRHRGAKNNTFEHCKAFEFNGFALRDGASYNRFKSCEGIGNESAVLFFDTDEDQGAQHAGKHNRFENCIFRGTTENIIDFYYYNEVSSCDSNIFANCVMDSANYLFNCDRPNHENKLVNCIVTGVDNYYRTAFHQDSTYDLNVVIKYSDFYNNGFAPPAGTHITTHAPGFVDAANHDYHLQGASLCIDAGTDEDAPETDKEGVYRPLIKHIDQGIYEYGIYWTGQHDVDWHTPDNWSNHQVPTMADSVNIPPPSYYYNPPSVRNNAAVKEIYLFKDAKLKIKQNVLFDVHP